MQLATFIAKVAGIALRMPEMGRSIFVAMLLMTSAAFAEKEFTPTEKATWGLMIAESLIDECEDELDWVTKAKNRILTFTGLTAFLRTEGHDPDEMRRAFDRHNFNRYHQLDRWLREAGFKPNSENIGEIFCPFGMKVAGRNHPVGRFLKWKK